MTPEELREYAATLMLDGARDVELLTIHEMAEDHLPGGSISDEDARKVADLIAKATVSVSFPALSPRPCCPHCEARTGSCARCGVRDAEDSDGDQLCGECDREVTAEVAASRGMP